MDEIYRTHRRLRDRTRIQASAPFEVRYWATNLRCTESELRAAIAAVGPGADVVRAYLAEARIV